MTAGQSAASPAATPSGTSIKAAVRRSGCSDKGATPASRATASAHAPAALITSGARTLKLSVRASNCLESENIHTVRDLVRRNEDQLLEVRNFGETTLHEVRERLGAIGLRLGMKVPQGAGARSRS